MIDFEASDGRVDGRQKVERQELDFLDGRAIERLYGSRQSTISPDYGEENRMRLVLDTKKSKSKSKSEKNEE